MPEARARIGQTNTLLSERLLLGQAVAVIANAQFQPSVPAASADAQQSNVLTRLNSVADGIFNQWLEQKGSKLRMKEE